ncbi:MAG: PIN domain-containing protein [Chloroflexi bacterium]|nr:PIN domain-containing protein [Chloroflexota bacterium]MBP8057171.1 PIN domain-containing protein [Chloroflexota bacterium]
MRVLLDTHIFIWGYLHPQSPSTNLLQLLRDHPEQFTLLFSDELLEQIRRVGRRVGGRRWVGGVLARIWQDFVIEMVEITEDDLIDVSREFPSVPSEDMGIFLIAYRGKADVMVSNNRKFVRNAAASQNLFTCLTVEEFLSQYTHQG